MAVNDHRRIIQPQWKRTGVDACEVADVLKDNVNNFRDNQEQLRHHEMQKRQQETGASEHEASLKKKNEIAQDAVFGRKIDIAEANRSLVKREIKKKGIRVGRRQYRKLMTAAVDDFAVRKPEDPFGMARVANAEIKDLPIDTLFTCDLKKVPSSRRRRLKSRRKRMLDRLEKSKKLRSRTNLFKGRGKNMKMKKVRMFGYSKKERLQINRLRGITTKSSIKGKASRRAVSKTRLVKNSRGGR